MFQLQTTDAQNTSASAATMGGAADSVVLRAGTSVELTFKPALSSERSKVGDTVEFEMLFPVKVGDAVVIADGTVGTGKIVAAKRRGHKGAAGVLAVAFDGVRLVTGDVAMLSAAAWVGTEKRLDS